MIYEFRTYTLRPGTVGSFLHLFEEALPARERFSPLAASWCTELGPLYQVIHVWPYSSENERFRIRREAVEAGIWPPDTGPFILSMKSEIFRPLPFSPDLISGSLGPVFELRTSILNPFSGPSMIEEWKKAWLTIWSYSSMQERADVEAKLTEGEGLATSAGFAGQRGLPGGPSLAVFSDPIKAFDVRR